MSKKNISLKKVAISGLPAAVVTVLRGFLSRHDIEIAAEGTLPDVILQAADSPVAFSPAIPRYVLPERADFQAATSLADILRVVEDISAAPALYVDDMQIGATLLQPHDRKLALSGGAEILLTDKEVDILICLARQPGIAVPRAELLARVWGYQTDIDTHTLETHIYRLRQKLGDVAGHLLQTDAGGYFILQPVVPAQP